MKKHWAHKLDLFWACVMMVAVLLAGCGNADSLGTEEIGIRLPTEIQPETVQTTEMPAETEKTDPNPGEETGFLHSYPLGTIVFYDLDGDGTQDQISANSQEYTDGQLTINDITIEYMAINPTGYFTIVNVDQSQDTLLVGISDYGFSDDDMTFLYAYDGTQITEIGAFEDILGQNSYEKTGAVCHGDGTISARVRMDVLGTWMSMGIYQMSEKGLVDCTEFYRRMDWENQVSGWEVITNVGLTMYEGSGLTGSQVMVSPGTMVRMIGVTSGPAESCHWACFEVDSLGKTLWLPTEEVEWQTSVQTEDGFLSSEEAFDGFFYAG